MKSTFIAVVAMVFLFRGAAVAHPHVFVTAQVTLSLENTGAYSVRLSWTYDEFFSLLLTTDQGLDLDGDMMLTETEQAQLLAVVTNWPVDYTGDLEVSQGAKIFDLAPRVNHQATYKDGIIEEIHTRPINGQIDLSRPITLQVYDPYYYVAYDLREPIVIEGRDDCTATIVRADLQEAKTLAEELLSGRSPDEVGPDGAFPPIGASFADKVTITCSD